MAMLHFTTENLKQKSMQQTYLSTCFSYDARKLTARLDTKNKESSQANQMHWSLKPTDSINLVLHAVHAFYFRIYPLVTALK